MKKTIALLAVVIFIVTGSKLCAQEGKILLPGNTYIFEIKDGSNRTGRLDSTTANYYFINNPAIGVDRISKRSVSKIKEIHLNKDGSFSNPHYSRYLFGPSALPQTKGEVYWNNVSFEYNTFQFGVTKNLSMGVGGFLFTSLSGNLVLLPNVKYSFTINEKSHIAVGALIALFHSKSGGGTPSASLPFLVYTYGDSEANISGGLGWANISDYGWAPKPTGYLAGLKRIARNWVFQGEAYMLNNNTENSIYIATFRNIKPSSSWDFGIVSMHFEDFRLALPIIGYTLKF
jgi:hypothetical protein